ncbi:hypothetical protein CEXT_143521 [Caerostris extrusa]|uniref:Uncharacterized protein n=1 Tax=Caerostris extrusa TaxID=172846 RepID=A0AAV4QFQ7_CAEEX|nr:hypothetical protein CEXT_143521 [Caerostris extrusa]
MLSSNYPSNIKPPSIFQRPSPSPFNLGQSMAEYGVQGALGGEFHRAELNPEPSWRACIPSERRHFPIRQKANSRKFEDLVLSPRI